MMAILDRRFPVGVDGDLVAVVADERLLLTRRWFVVARRAVVSAWKAAPPAFSEHVQYLAFEDVVESFGGKIAFNELVGEMLDFDFYDEWIMGTKS